MNSGYSKGLLRDSISWCVKTSVRKMIASPVFVDWPVVRNLNEHKSQCFVFQKKPENHLFAMWKSNYFCFYICLVIKKINAL